jgi:hypothetical protein
MDGRSNMTVEGVGKRKYKGEMGVREDPGRKRGAQYRRILMYI